MQQRAFLFLWMPVLTWENATCVQGRKNMGMPTVVFKRRSGTVAVWSLVWRTVIVMDTSGSTEEENENGHFYYLVKKKLKNQGVEKKLT